MVEAAKSKIKTETAGGGRTAPEAEEAGGGSPEGPGEDGAKAASRLVYVGGDGGGKGANGLDHVGGASGRVLHAEVHGDHEDGMLGGARGGLDPAAVAAVLRAVERCLGREAVERLAACLYV
jgi:hypothetical protein